MSCKPIAISENFNSTILAKTPNPKQIKIKIIGEEVLKKDIILFISEYYLIIKTII